MFNKIAKHKKITYFSKQRDKKTYCIIADLHMIRNYENEYEACVAWVNIKSKSIEWNECFENVIDKNLIKNFIVNE